MVGEKSSVTFYIGDDLDDLSTTKVSLPQNEKIHGFSLTDDTLFASVAAKTSEENQQNPYIESFDLETGKSIKKLSLSAPLYALDKNDRYPFTSGGAFDASERSFSVSLDGSR